MVASGDMAHATHPDYPERHEPAHPIFVNAGIPTVDVGAPQLAMHSARELMGPLMSAPMPPRWRPSWHRR
jgi:aspartyl aminopeptidase